MRIIRQGVKTVKFICPECGCVFEADEDEYKDIGVVFKAYIYKCKCPCCGEKVLSWNI